MARLGSGAVRNHGCFFIFLAGELSNRPPQSNCRSTRDQGIKRILLVDYSRFLSLTKQALHGEGLHT